MKHRVLGAAIAVLLSMWLTGTGTGCFAQEFGAVHHGVVQDWSQRHIVFTRDGLANHPDVMLREPRVWFQALQHWPLPASAIGGAEPRATVGDSSSPRDWNMTTGTGRISPDMFPLKYTFDPGVPPSCTNDFVVVGLATIGSTGAQANLVGINNLYAGTGGYCGASPTVMFAYNTSSVGGRIVTSPVISQDGLKVAFVESTVVGGPAHFHVLTWTAGQGTILASAAPTMTDLNYSPAANNSISAPWVDYTSDTAYVGSDDGKIYKIHPVFTGTPALVGAPWPVTLSANFHPTAPVLDSNLGLLMVGSADGNLYRIDANTGVVTPAPIGSRGGGRVGYGVIAPPIVDITNGTTFAVSSNDATSGVLVEVDTKTLAELARGRIGQASTNPGRTVIKLFEPAFSDAYFNDPSTGEVRLCGTGDLDTSPWQYAFGFSGKTMNTTPVFSQQLLVSLTARCTGWTEFLNPNIGGAGGTDFFFLGLNRDCTGVGTTAGCVMEISGNSTITTATINGGSSGIVVDNYSTLGQASSIYFSAGLVNRFYKLTQNGLQ